VPQVRITSKTPFTRACALATTKLLGLDAVWGLNAPWDDAGPVYPKFSIDKKEVKSERYIITVGCYATAKKVTLVGVLSNDIDFTCGIELDLTARTAKVFITPSEYTKVRAKCEADRKAKIEESKTKPVFDIITSFGDSGGTRRTTRNQRQK